MKESIKASVTACAICGTPLAAWRPLDGVLCRSQVCAGKHAALPARLKCAHCTRPLTSRQFARGHCDSVLCRDEGIRARREQAVALKLALLARLAQRRERSAAQRGISRDAQATYRAALLPRNTDRTSRLTVQRRALHEAHLRESLSDARAQHEKSPPPDGVAMVTVPDHRTPTQRAEALLLQAACAACRGKCCGQGGDHAFLSADSMMAYLRRFPAADDDAVVSHYMQHIGEQTMTHGCIYQGEHGCTLAPEMRADICHSFYCSGLIMLSEQFVRGEPVRAYLVHRRGEHLYGDRFIEIDAAADSGAANASEGGQTL